MSKAMWYVFILILVFLLVAYYKGSSSVIGSISDFFRSFVLILQGRDNSGKITNYPQ